MPDIRLVPISPPLADVVSLDWLLLPSGRLDESQELATAVTVALCSDALADPSEVLPDPNSDDRRGWWGDLDAETIWNGWPLGSRLWLLSRAKILGAGSREGSTVARVNSYITAALAPFVSAGICSRFDVTVAQVNIQRIDAQVTIYRGPKSSIQLQFQALWDGIAA